MIQTKLNKLFLTINKSIEIIIIMNRGSSNEQLMANLSILINKKTIKTKDKLNNKNNQTNPSMAGKSHILINHFNK